MVDEPSRHMSSLKSWPWFCSASPLLGLEKLEKLPVRFVLELVAYLRQIDYQIRADNLDQIIEDHGPERLDVAMGVDHQIIGQSCFAFLVIQTR